MAAVDLVEICQSFDDHNATAKQRLVDLGQLDPVVRVRRLLAPVANEGTNRLLAVAASLVVCGAGEDASRVSGEPEGKLRRELLGFEAFDVAAEPCLHGGDAARTVTYGFSAGTGPALASALAPSDVAIAGCNARTTPEPVAGVVLGDGEYFWQSEAFDDAFRDDLDAMQASVATFTEPAAWPDDLEATFFLWAAEDGTAPRSTGDPWDASGWLAQRDPAGSLRDDLERLDQLGDGVISYIDSAQLLRLRLAEAGHDVKLAITPGGHTIDDKVAQLVEWLAAAAN